MRLIDADVLKKSMCETCTGLVECGEHTKCSVIEDVDNAPTVDAVPVVHAEWVKKDGMSMHYSYSMRNCSNCNFIVGLKHTYITSKAYFRYCPKCGAKMDGGKANYD